MSLTGITDLVERARSLGSQPVAVVNAGSGLPLASARDAQAAGLIDPVLVGDTEAIKREANILGWDLNGVRLVAAPDELSAGNTAAILARDGEVTALIKGDIHSDNLLRAVLNKDNGLRTGKIGRAHV